jgi:hypothetical protein
MSGHVGAGHARPALALIAPLLLCALTAPAQPVPALWQDPGNPAVIEHLDLAGSLDSGVPAPRPPFTFLREDPSGTQPKLFTRDAAGRMWNVKFGSEVHNECFCWRVVHACGYFAEPSFFVASGQFANYQLIHRATPSIHSDGRFTDARFQYRDPGVKFLENRSWRWDRPPFAGTKELDGLKILIMLFSNWDNKDGRVGAGGPNTAMIERFVPLLYPDGKATVMHRLIYAFTDWGSGMGRWSSVPGSDSNWNCADYTAQTPSFVKDVQHGHVVFGWEGALNEGFRDAIPPAHVRWFMQYLGRITDAQLMAGLKAAGASDRDASCFTRALGTRIEELRKVAANKN